MANYFQDPAQTFIPTPVYQPPFEAIQQIVGTKQAQYNQGLAEVKNIRNSIFNQDVTNTVLSNRKNAFLDDAENQLSDLSQVDLSIEGNKNKAANVFAPFYKDQEMVNDIVTTKYNKSQIALGQSFLQDKDPKVREQYWSESIRNIQNTLENLRNGDPSDKTIYKQSSYVPYEDMGAFVTNALKDAGFKVVTVKGMDGPQLASIENGELSAKNYQTFIQGIIGTKFDPMMRVIGQNEMYDRTKSYIDKGLNKQDARSQVAKDYIQSRAKDLEENIKDFDGQVGLNNTLMSQLIDPNTQKLYRPEDSDKYLQLGMQNAMIKKQKVENETLLGSLANNKGANYLDMYNNIYGSGEDFFGQLTKRTLVNNLAVSFAAGTKTTVSENKSYFDIRKDHREDEQLSLDKMYKLQQIKESQWKMAGGIVNGKKTLNADGTKIDDNSEDDKKIDEFNDKGNIGTSIKTDPDPYKTKMENLQGIYLSGRSIQIDAISKFLPMLLPNDISKEDSVAWANQFKNNYSSGESPAPNLLYRTISEKLGKYLINKKHPYKANSPSSLLDALKEAVTDAMSAKVNSNTSFTPEESEAFTSKWSDAEKMIEDYGQQMKIINENVNKGIEQLIKDDKENKYTSYLEKNSEGNWIINNKGGIISNKPNSTNTLNPTIFGGSSSDITNLPGYNNPQLHGKFALPPLENKINEIRKNAVNSLIGKNDSKIGRGLEFSVLPPTAKNPLGSEGYLLGRETLNPDNNMMREDTKNSSEIDKKQALMDYLNSNFSDAVKTVVYNTLGEVTYNINTTEADKDTKLVDIYGKGKIPSTLTLRQSPVASGNMTNKLKNMNQEYQVFDGIRQGKIYKSDPFKDSMGFSYKIYGDNYGENNRNKTATVAYVDITVKDWDPTIKDKETGLESVGGWTEPKTVTVKIPLSGPNGKLPDNIMEYVNQEWATHFYSVNTIRQQWEEMLRVNKEKQLPSPTKTDLDEQLKKLTLTLK